MSYTIVREPKLDELVTANRSRAVGAGIDPNQYEQVTSRLMTVGEWTPAFRAAALEHRERADAARDAERHVSAGEAYLHAARWSHFATCWPNPDRFTHAMSVADAAGDYREALSELDPAALWIERRTARAPFVGVLRRPRGLSKPPLALIVCGLDSGKEEFHYVSEALLARGMATFAFDGPGQAELSATTTIEPEYDRVVAHLLDTLAGEKNLDIDHGRVGVVALSLGGFYGVKSAAADARVRALVTVSGVCSLTWETLPSVVIDTLIQRTGSEQAARAFAATVDSVRLAKDLTVPLLVVAGGQDPIPTAAEAQRVAAASPYGELHLVPEGDHLLANAQWQWLGRAGDWLAERLGAGRSLRDG